MHVMGPPLLLRPLTLTLVSCRYSDGMLPDWQVR